MLNLSNLSIYGFFDMKNKIIILFFGYLLLPTTFAHALSPRLSSGLVSYWQLDETSGNATDLVGSNTLINNNVNYSLGKQKNAANFTAANAETLSVSDASQSGLNFLPGQPLSFAFWFKASSGAADVADKVIISKSDTSGGYMLALENGGYPHARIGGYLSTDEVSTESGYHTNGYISAIQLDDNNWHHVVVSYDGSTEVLYIDGVKAADTTLGSVNNTTAADFFLGFRTGGTGSNYFDGQIDEVGVWGRALSASEVTDLYNSYPPANTPPVASVVATSTDEDTSTSIILLGSDADGNTLTFATTTSPAHGTLSTLVGSTTTYTPDPNYNGSDSFDFVVSDGQATSSPATATITINPVNDAPIIGAINSQTATSGDTVIFIATSTDVDGGAPTYTIASSSTSTAATINPTTGAFSWLTTGFAAGNYTFSIAVSDGATSTATSTTIMLFAAPASTSTPPVATSTTATSTPPADPGATSTPTSTQTPGMSGGGVVGGPLSVGYQNNSGTNSHSLGQVLGATVQSLTPASAVSPSQKTTTPPSSATANKPATLATVNNPKTTPPQTTTPTATTATPPSAQPLLTSTSNTQLASPAASGFSLHVPLWVCAVGAAAVAGAGAWWWLGLGAI